MDNKEKVLRESQQIFLSYVTEIENKRANEVAIRKAIKKFDVKNAKIQNLTPLRVKKIFSSLETKYSSGYTSSKNWLENERRLYIWCVICYLHQNGKEISQLTDEDFQFFAKIFVRKDMSLLKFQAFSLIKKNNKNTGWKKEEDEMLLRIIQKKNLDTLEWSQISKQFFENLGQKSFRNAKQCRERWLNHLDPHKVKGKWTKEQDRLLLLDVLDKGKKWSQIVSTLQGKKNEHMIKNRFKSLIHKKQKQIKRNNVKQKELINLILQSLDHESCQMNQLNDELDDQNFSERKALDEDKEIKKRMKIKNKKSKQETEKLEDFSSRKKTNCLIVEPKNQLEKERKKQQQRPEMDDFFDEKNQEFIEKLLHNAPTPMPDNRFSSIFLQARSPANFVMSPFPPGWTPIFFVDESQRQMSPQVNMGEFGSKFKNDFHKFVNEQTERRN